MERIDGNKYRVRWFILYDNVGLMLWCVDSVSEQGPLLDCGTECDPDSGTGGMGGGVIRWDSDGIW
jgi:hypothetical protein